MTDDCDVFGTAVAFPVGMLLGFTKDVFETLETGLTTGAALRAALLGLIVRIGTNGTKGLSEFKGIHCIGNIRKALFENSLLPLSLLARRIPQTSPDFPAVLGGAKSPPDPPDLPRPSSKISNCVP